MLRRPFFRRVYGRLVCSHRTLGGHVDRAERLIVFCVALSLTLAAALWSPSARAWDGSIHPDQSGAMADCQAFIVNPANADLNATCVFISGLAPASSSLCTSGLYSGKYQAKASNGTLMGAGFFWCVPADCSVYDSGSSSTQYGAPYSEGGVYCDHSCMSVFHGGTGVSSITFPDGSGGSFGHFVGNGNRCTSATDSDLLKKANPPPPLCDHNGVSCYNRDRGFCATTESGEVVCEPAPPAGAGTCAAGATGATCVGNNTPPPTPPDPPIGKGTPPTSAGTATGKDSGGNTYNYTQNNYSGTSPGPGAPASGATSGAGSQSNTSGSGNSPGPNGSAGTNTSGKCSDGSVPTASGCSGTATDNGCKTPPACYGDAVMCAQFKEQVAIRCNTAAASASSSSLTLGTPSSALAGAGVPGDGGASSDPSTSGLVSSTDLGQDGFDASGLGFSRTCPASPQFSVLGHSYTLDLTPLCNFASLLGWFVLLCAFLVSLRIVSASRV